MPEIPVLSTKKAVLVGVHSKPEKFLRKVPGAHRDVKQLRDLLVDTYQYDPQNIAVLVDSEKILESHHAARWPTKENILQAMRELVKDRQVGDHIVFSFSGHSERDILIPSDYEVVEASSNKVQYSHVIHDNEIREIFIDGLAEGVQCTLIFDCNYSGAVCGALAECQGENEDIGPLARTPGFTKKETVYHRHAARAKDVDPNTVVGSGAKEVTSWFACSDGQNTYGSHKGGFFTNAFVGILQDANYDGKTITHRDLLLGLQTKLETLCHEANLKQGWQDEAWLELKTPLPQLRTLIPECVLDKRFTL